MIAALRTLGRDGWVLGIATAAALAYVTVTLLDSTIYVVMSIVDGYPVPDDDGSVESGLSSVSSDFYPWSAEINGHLVLFEPLARAFALFLLVVPLAAAVLHATRSDDVSVD